MRSIAQQVENLAIVVAQKIVQYPKPGNAGRRINFVINIAIKRMALTLYVAIVRLFHDVRCLPCLINELTISIIRR